jgi:luciferase family oxidoreductase group 1
MNLSILYFGHVGAAVDFMAAADALGFTRFWLGEHHSRWQCANPLMLGSLLAATTQGIRIGSGGACLTYQSPLRIAEDARLIEYMLPDRFDLGVTRGLKLPPEMRDLMFDGRPPETLRPYDRKLDELHHLLTGRPPESLPAGVEPHLENGPPMWLLGASESSALWAARHGTGFCFSLHHGTTADGAAVIAAYYRHFVPSPEFAAPRAIVVASMVTAATRDLALAERESNGLGDVTVVDAPHNCVAAFESIADRHQVDEVMVLDLVPGHAILLQERYSHLAELAGLAPRPGGGEP